MTDSKSKEGSTNEIVIEMNKEKARGVYQILLDQLQDSARLQRFAEHVDLTKHLYEQPGFVEWATGGETGEKMCAFLKIPNTQDAHIQMYKKVRLFAEDVTDIRDKIVALIEQQQTL